MLDAGASIFEISKKYNVKWKTARDFIRDRLNYDLNTIESRIIYQERLKNKINFR